MRTLNEHIKTGRLKNVYLLYGPEVYLKKQYRDKLKNAIIGDDTMNYNYYTGKGQDIHALIAMAETMPFFAERRLLIIENSGFFASSNDALAEYIPSIPETTYIVFVEDEVDKRNKVFKAVSSTGYAANLSSPDEKTLKLWIAGLIKKEGKNITERAILRFLEIVDNDMENIHQELEKLLCYTAESDVITEDDILKVCSVHTENKIFDMIHAVAMKNQREALRLYDDLLTLKEPPLRILALISKQFNTLLQIKALSVRGYTSSVIAQRTGMKKFIVKKNLVMTRKFSMDELREALECCVQSEEEVKTGLLNDRMAVEILIIKYSA